MAFRAGSCALAAWAALGAGLLPGCTSKFPPGDPPKIDSLALSAATKQKMADRVGAPIDHVFCGGDLEARVGATERCMLFMLDGSRINVTDTVTKVEGKVISFDAVADEPTGRR